jgi:hypothetical protein
MQVAFQQKELYHCTIAYNGLVKKKHWQEMINGTVEIAKAIRMLLKRWKYLKPPNI